MSSNVEAITYLADNPEMGKILSKGSNQQGELILCSLPSLIVLRFIQEDNFSISYEGPNFLSFGGDLTQKILDFLDLSLGKDYKVEAINEQRYKSLTGKGPITSRGALLLEVTKLQTNQPLVCYMAPGRLKIDLL